MKNTTAQNVDPDRVEMASGYRMKTRPAPGRNIRGLVTGWKCRWERQVGGGASAGLRHDSAMRGQGKPRA